MSTEQILKEQLRSIAANEFQAPEQIDPFQLALDMMSYIGVTDSQLRDDLIYSVLWNWITHNVFSKSQLQQILSIAMDEAHLFFHIGERDTDTVFTRAFSVLLLPPILIVHRHESFLTRSEVLETKRNVLRYFSQEKDLRGYMRDKGWAHAAAHAADVLDELALCVELERSDLMEILQAVQAKASVQEKVYICEEDERMATAVVSVLGRGLCTDAEVKRWLGDFVSLAQQPGSLPESLYRFVNVKNFLRSFYFRICREAMPINICQAIGDVLKEISRF